MIIFEFYSRTNLPKEIMAFLDFPFPEEGNSYLKHLEVLEYLKNYCQKYEIESLIKVSRFEINRP